MIIKLIVVGKTVKSYLKQGEEEYTNRLKHYVRFEEEVISELKNVSSLNEDQIKHKEGEEILKRIQPTDYLVLLDEQGKQITSEEFAEKIIKWQNTSVKQVVFVVGGAYSFSKEVYDRCNEKLSLSKMTFSHQMVRVFFKEQLYRAYSIIKGEPYHHR
jgi:23S rRNA (pseudouridine1915-N3)-methyltransferase